MLSKKRPVRLFPLMAGMLEGANHPITFKSRLSQSVGKLEQVTLRPEDPRSPTLNVGLKKPAAIFFFFFFSNNFLNNLIPKMSASATASSFLSLPTLTPKTQLLCNSTPSFSVKFHAKPISQQLFSRPSASSRFVRHVAVSSELDQEDDFASDGDEPNFSPDLKLFVGNLPFTVDSAQLAGLFESAGNVEMVEVIYDRETGRSRGFGFVTMSTVEEVEAAAQQFNGYELDGRALRVNHGPPPPKRESNFERGGGYESRAPRGGGYENRAPRGGGYENRAPRGDGYESRGPRGGGGGDSPNKVHVSNLSWGVDDAALESLFSEQGNVLEAKVIYDRDSGRSRGFGFVTYGSPEEVISAIDSLDGADLDGRQIRVSPAENKPRRSF